MNLPSLFILGGKQYVKKKKIQNFFFILLNIMLKQHNRLIFYSCIITNVVLHECNRVRNVIGNWLFDRQIEYIAFLLCELRLTRMLNVIFIEFFLNKQTKICY